MADHTAGPQFAGYLYQAEQALLMALKLDFDATIRLEGLDDIETSSDGKKSLVQAKHHIKKEALLTDSSTELWKTIRVWADYLLAPSHSITDTSLLLLTVASAPAGSAAGYLRTADRDEKKANQLLTSIAEKALNKALKASYESFLKLNLPQRRLLFSMITVVDGAIQVTECEKSLKKLLELSTRPEYLQALYERLKGWWYDKVLEQITDPSVPAIDVGTIRNKIYAIQDTLKPSSLPIDYLEAYPPENYPWTDKVYVCQLRAIDVKERRIANAVLDYYRAFQQRSRWIRDSLLVDDDLLAYESILIQEWKRKRNIIEDDYGESLSEADQKTIGKKLLNWMEEDADILIRPNVTEGYVMRGSFHILADEFPPIRSKPAICWNSAFGKQNDDEKSLETEGEQ